MRSFAPTYPNRNLLGSENATYSMHLVEHQIGNRVYELSNHLGNVLTTISDKPMPYDDDADDEADWFIADIRTAQDYSPFGVTLSRRNFSVSEGYRYGFNGMEKDDEVKGSGNSYDFGARMLDPRLGRWLTIDPLAAKYNDMSPYALVGNTPIQAFDPDGELIIWVNGEAPMDEWANSKYWVHNNPIVDAIGTFNDRIKDWKNVYRSGDQTPFTVGSDWPNDRKNNGRSQAKTDFEDIKAVLKAGMVDGKITETVKIISHSKGSAYANGYAEVLDEELKKWREAEPELFAGDGGKIEIVVHLAPHQSDWIDVKQNDYPTIGITHKGDILSDDDASGDIANITTKSPSWAENSHTISGFWDQLDKIFDKHKQNKENGVKNKYNGMSGLLKNQLNYKKANTN